MKMQANRIKNKATNVLSIREVEGKLTGRKSFQALLESSDRCGFADIDRQIVPKVGCRSRKQ